MELHLEVLEVDAGEIRAELERTEMPTHRIGAV